MPGSERADEIRKLGFAFPVRGRWANQTWVVDRPLGKIAAVGERRGPRMVLLLLIERIRARCFARRAIRGRCSLILIPATAVSIS